MLDYMQRLTEKGKVEERPLNAVRVKLHVPCQWTCNFCHMEGSHHSGSVDDHILLLAALGRLREKFGFQEVYLTGGEPSIHARIVEYVGLLYDAGYVIKMTTNGVTHPDVYLRCVEAGLSEVNISMHTMNAAALGALMEPPRSVRWGEKNLRAQKNLCKLLAQRINVKINTCVGVDEAEALAIAGFSREAGVYWRPMNELEIPGESYAAIRRMCESLGAKPVVVRFTKGSSSFSVVMRTDDGFEFAVKLIRPFKLPAMCEACPLEASGMCYEYAYGPRLEQSSSVLVVRNCLHRQGSPFQLAVGDFLGSDIAANLKEALRG